MLLKCDYWKNNNEIFIIKMSPFNSVGIIRHICISCCVTTDERAKGSWLLVAQTNEKNTQQ